MTPVDVMTQIHKVNTKLIDYHAIIDIQLSGFVTFSEIMGT